MRYLNCWDNKNFWGAKSVPPSPATSVKTGINACFQCKKRLDERNRFCQKKISHFTWLLFFWFELFEQSDSMGWWVGAVAAFYASSIQFNCAKKSFSVTLNGTQKSFFSFSFLIKGKEKILISKQNLNIFLIVWTFAWNVEIFFLSSLLPKTIAIHIKLYSKHDVFEAYQFQ